jgi:hypothetical protein
LFPTSTDVELEGRGAVELGEGMERGLERVVGNTREMRR